MHEHQRRARQLRSGEGLLLSVFITVLALGSCAEPGEDFAAPVIVTPSELRLVPGADTPWDISIDDKGVTPRRTFLLVRGLTPDMRLSVGRAFGTGVWLVPLDSIASLKIGISADAVQGAFIELSLATLEGTPLAQQRVRAFIVNPRPLASTRTIATVPMGGSQLSPKEREAALKLVEMGNSELKRGNPLTARQFYRRATDRALPQAATALGASYDPAELTKIEGLVTVRPDVKLARKWYEKAVKLGDPSALDRMQRLPQP